MSVCASRNGPPGMTDSSSLTLSSLTVSSGGTVICSGLAKSAVVLGLGLWLALALSVLADASLPLLLLEGAARQAGRMGQKMDSLMPSDSPCDVSALLAAVMFRYGCVEAAIRKRNRAATSCQAQPYSYR